MCWVDRESTSVDRAERARAVRIVSFLNISLSAFDVGSIIISFG